MHPSSSRRSFCLSLLAVAGACLAAPGAALAWSSDGPPRTGLEPSDQPRRLRGTPGAAALRDAYGNSILDDVVPEKKPAKRLPPGAYGTYGRKKAEERPLPEERDESPLW